MAAYRFLKIAVGYRIFTIVFYSNCADLSIYESTSSQICLRLLQSARAVRLSARFYSQ